MNYTIYLHRLIADSSKARYVGYTSQKLEERWRNGEGYKGQFFYSAIKQYGWDAFEHRILEVGDASPEYIGEREKYWCDFFKASTQYEGGFTQMAGSFAGTTLVINKNISHKEFLLSGEEWRFAFKDLTKTGFGIWLLLSSFADQSEFTYSPSEIAKLGLMSKGQASKVLTELKDKEYIQEQNFYCVPLNK